MNDIEIIISALEDLKEKINFDHNKERFENNTYKSAINYALATIKERQVDKDKKTELEERNEKLYEDNLTLAQELKDFISGTNDAKYYSVSFVKNHYINKDTIKEKIEELDRQEKAELKGMKGQDRYAVKQEYQHKRNILQELLGE